MHSIFIILPLQEQADNNEIVSLPSVRPSWFGHFCGSVVVVMVRLTSNDLALPLPNLYIACLFFLNLTRHIFGFGYVTYL